MKIKWLVVPVVLVLATVGTIAALPMFLQFWGERQPVAWVKIDPVARTEAIDALVENINRHYVFPEKAQQIETLLRTAQKQGRYDAISDGAELASLLTADIASVAHDLHMSVQASTDVLPPQRQAAVGSQAGSAPAPPPNMIMRTFDNLGKMIGTFGVVRVDHLTPRIGYLKTSHLAPAHLAGDKFGAAMDKLADTDAMIIDMRENGSGYPRSVALLISYFVDRRTRLNDLWSRDTGKTEQFWTEDRLAGKRYGSVKPVVILVGPGTQSGGEDFAYTMQALKRATVMGEPTWGGAHPHSSYRLGDHLHAWIPDYRSISPITKTNWEGVGVKPDIPVASPQALAEATALLQRQLKGI